MLPILGQPLLAYTLRYLARYGHHGVAVNLHYRPQVIVDYFWRRIEIRGLHPLLQRAHSARECECRQEARTLLCRHERFPGDLWGLLVDQNLGA